MKRDEGLTNTSYWDERRGKIRCRKGGWKIGKGVFSHGFNMMEELAGEFSYFQVLVLHATGRLPSKRLADWVEAAFICLSWPDPRIWCNQIGALGGSMRTSVVAATCAGTLAGDSRIYGQKPLLEGMDFIQMALQKKKGGLTINEIVVQECARHGGKPQVMGYARPIAKGDERVAAMERVTAKLGFEIGEHLATAYEIERILAEAFDESMNINGYSSAFLSDQGFTPQEAYQFCSILVASGVLASYVDTLERPAESFFPLRCEDIDYQGPPARPVPLREAPK